MPRIFTLSPGLANLAQVEAFSGTVQRYISRLHDPNVAARRGFILALGALPRRLIAANLNDILSALCNGTVPEDRPEERDVESRVNCVESLGQVCEQVGMQTCTA